MAYSPKKVVQTANLTDFTIKIYLFLLKNRHYFRELAYE